MSQPSQPDLTAVLRKASASAVAAVNVASPATVVSYDHDTQTATIQIAPSFRYVLGGETILYRPDPVANVPVAFLNGSGGTYSDTWPLAAGDQGIAVYCDRSTDEWKSTGADATDPQDPRRHSIIDAIFIPGGRPVANPIGSAGIDASARVIAGDAIKLGGSTASDFVALSSLTEAELADLVTRINTALTAAIAALTAPLAPELVAFQAQLATAMAGFPGSTASARVKSL